MDHNKHGAALNVERDPRESLRKEAGHVESLEVARTLSATTVARRAT